MDLTKILYCLKTAVSSGAVLSRRFVVNNGPKQRLCLHPNHHLKYTHGRVPTTSAHGSRLFANDAGKSSASKDQLDLAENPTTQDSGSVRLAEDEETCAASKLTANSDAGPSRTQAITEYYAQYEKEFQQVFDPSSDLVEMEGQSELIQAKFPISMERGKTGVFDVEELVQLVHYERGEDITTIRVDPTMDYVDHLVIVTCRSVRQMKSMEAKIVRLWKHKRNDGDPFLNLAGTKPRQPNDTWRVLDLDNIVLHLMTHQIREYYDLETLWCVGPELDDKAVELTEVDAWQAMLAQHAIPISVAGHSGNDQSADGASDEAGAAVGTGATAGGAWRRGPKVIRKSDNVVVAADGSSSLRHSGKRQFSTNTLINYALQSSKDHDTGKFGDEASPAGVVGGGEAASVEHSSKQQTDGLSLIDTNEKLVEDIIQKNYRERNEKNDSNDDDFQLDLEALTSDLQSRILQAEAREHHEFIVKSATADQVEAEGDSS